MVRMRAAAKAEAAAAVERRRGEAPAASSVRPVAARLLLRELGATAAPGIGGAPARPRKRLPPAAAPVLATAAAALQAASAPVVASIPGACPGARLRRLLQGRPAIERSRIAAAWPGSCAAAPLERAGRGGMGRLVAMAAIGAGAWPHGSAGSTSVSVLYRSRGEAAVLRLLPAGPLLRRGEAAMRLRQRVEDGARDVDGADATDSGAQLLLGAPMSGGSGGGGDAIEEWGCFRLPGAAAAATQLDSGPRWMIGACLAGDVRAAVLLAEPGTAGPRLLALLGGGRDMGGRAGDRGAGVVTRMAWAAPGSVPGAETGQVVVGGLASGVVCLWDLRASTATPQAVMPMSQSDHSFASAPQWSPPPLKPRWAMSWVPGAAGSLRDLWAHGSSANGLRTNRRGAVCDPRRGALGGAFARSAPPESLRLTGHDAPASLAGAGRGRAEGLPGADRAPETRQARRPRFGLGSAGQARPSSARFGLQAEPGARSGRREYGETAGRFGLGSLPRAGTSSAASLRQGSENRTSSSGRLPVSSGSRFGLLSLSAGSRAAKRRREPASSPTESDRVAEATLPHGATDRRVTLSAGSGRDGSQRQSRDDAPGYEESLLQADEAELEQSMWKDPWSQWARDRPTVVVGSGDVARRGGTVTGLAFSCAGQRAGASAVACVRRSDGDDKDDDHVNGGADDNAGEAARGGGAGSTPLMFVGRAGGSLEAVDCRKLRHAAFGSDPAPAAMLRVRAATVVARALNRGGAARAAAGIAQPVAARLADGVSRLLPAGNGSLLLMLADGTVAWLDAANGTCESAWAPRTPFAAAAATTPDVCALWRGSGAVAVGGATRASAVSRLPPTAWAAGAGGALTDPYCARSAMVSAAPVEAAHAVMGAAEGLSAVCQLGPGAALAGTREGDLVGILGM